MGQIASLIGATLILVAYFCSQRGWMKDKAVNYLSFNFVGGALLAYTAILSGNWGFIILEASWTLISLVSLVKVTNKEEKGITGNKTSAEGRIRPANFGGEEKGF